MLGWLSKSEIPERITVCISLPNEETWRADFLGALYPLTLERNWEEFGTLTSEEMADEWRAIFLEFVNGECSMIPVGAILPYAGNSAPTGFFLCDHSTFVIADFPELYAVIGVTWGIGNGTTTANLPDLRGNVLVGKYSALDYCEEVGVVGGEHEHSLLLSEIPSHNHTQDSHNHTQDSHNHTQNSHNHTQDSHTHIIDGGINSATGAVSRGLIASGSGSNNTVSRSATATNQAATATNQAATAANQAATATNQAAGGGAVHNNLQPYVTVNYIIKY